MNDEGMAERVLRLRRELAEAETALEVGLGLRRRAGPPPKRGLKRRALEMATRGPVTAKEIAAEFGTLEHSARAAISKLVKAGRAERTDDGVRAVVAESALEGLVC